MAAGAASATRVVHLPESLPLPLVRFLLARPRSVSGDLRILAVDRAGCPRTIFALGRSEGRPVILCLVNGEAGEAQLREARRREAAAALAQEGASSAAARPRILALASRFAGAWQDTAGSVQHEEPELWLWSAAAPTDPEPMRLSRFNRQTGRAETRGEPAAVTPTPRRRSRGSPGTTQAATGRARDVSTPVPRRPSRITRGTSTPAAGRARDASPPVPAPDRTGGGDGTRTGASRLESPDPWSVALAPGSTRLSPDEIASLLDPAGAGTNPGEGAGA